ncbi:MAG: TIGR04013 family B12-binding domain/radical SAM domain-containing protein [Chlorobiales bacterium]|nr:TIGR04013 family B12-binding domain/radical SAM domain-containing protein [Chlorobiales bacterium]
MKSNLALVLYYTKANKYSFNALVGAIETKKYFENLSIYFYGKEEELFNELGRICQKHDKTMLGISFFTTQLWDTYNYVRKIRDNHCDRLLLVAGGPHPTGDPKGTLKIGFDIVVKGEGEETLLEILEKIDRDEDLSNIKGLAFIDEKGEYHENPRRSWIDLDKYPPFSVKHEKFGNIEITRGCPYACYFCQTPQILGGRPRHRSIEKISEYVYILKERNLTDIRFITSNAFSYGSIDGKKVDISCLEELLKSVKKIILPKGRIFLGSFPSEVRPDHVIPETVELIKKYAHNDNLIIGAQSGSQKILDICHRNHTVNDVYNSVQLTLKAGLKANVDFIFGLPNETDKDIKDTIIVMSDLVKMGARVHTHTFIPLPHTPFSKYPPGHLSKDLRKLIDDLTAKGIAYGDWKAQENIAKKIAKYFRTGELKV